jgi:hypothetical protein
MVRDGAELIRELLEDGWPILLPLFVILLVVSGFGFLAFGVGWLVGSWIGALLGTSVFLSVYWLARR